MSTQKIIIIGDVPEDYLKRIEESKPKGFEIVFVDKISDLKEYNDVKVGIIGNGIIGDISPISRGLMDVMSSGFIGNVSLPPQDLSELRLKPNPIFIPEIKLTETSSFFDKKSRYQKREYRKPATPIKKTKKRK